MDKFIGRLLDGRYEILEEIGRGGMAVVYRAMDHRLNRYVAVKILKEELSRDEDFRRRFHAESQAVAMLSHANIVAVYDVNHSGEADYIVMELIDGLTLKQYMQQRGALSWREALHFATQIAKAIEHAHSRGIVHRDIKPHNIMILKDGSVKVADFGIARLSSSQNTLTREALGSVHYISPEQAKGEYTDERSDIYSLGMMLKDMGFNAEYHNVIEKCCRFGRNERFEDVAELMEAVDKRRFNRPADELTDAQPSISSNKKMAVIIAVIVVLVCVAVALLVAQNGSDQSQQEPQQTEQNDSITTRDTSDQDSTDSEQPKVTPSADSTQTEQAQGDNAFLNDLVPQMHTDLDKIYNSGADPATIHAKVGAYYKGLRRVLKKQGKTSTQLDAFDKAFAEYTQQKNQ